MTVCGHYMPLSPDLYRTGGTEETGRPLVPTSIVQVELRKRGMVMHGGTKSVQLMGVHSPVSQHGTVTGLIQLPMITSAYDCLCGCGSALRLINDPMR